MNKRRKKRDRALSEYAQFVKLAILSLDSFFRDWPSSADGYMFPDWIIK